MTRLKAKIVEPETGAERAGGVRFLPGGEVAFTQAGYDWWKPRLAKLGVDIDAIQSRSEWEEAVILSINARCHEKSGFALLASTLTTDPTEKLELEKQAETLKARELAEKQRTEKRAKFRIATASRGSS